MYLSIPWYVWLIWLVILAASETSYVPQERLRLPPCRHSGSFSIKTGNLPHPLGYTRSQIKSLLYISFSLCNSSCRSVCFCIPKWLLEQQQATLQDKWGQAQCNFHINHSVSSLGWGEGERERGRNGTIQGEGERQRLKVWKQMLLLLHTYSSYYWNKPFQTEGKVMHREAQSQNSDQPTDRATRCLTDRQSLKLFQNLNRLLHVGADWVQLSFRS